MLIFDANNKEMIKPEGALLDKYLKGVFDSAEFKEEDHPRGGKGSEGGGRFVKSEKTKRKEDEVDNLGDGSSSDKVDWFDLYDDAHAIDFALSRLHTTKQITSEQYKQYKGEWSSLNDELKNADRKHDGAKGKECISKMKALEKKAKSESDPSKYTP